MNKITLPVLILPEVVFFPKTALPLLVEDRAYIAMLKKCAEDQSPVAIALGSIHQEANLEQLYLTPQPICGYGKVIIIEEFLEPNNCSIRVLVKGIGRLQLSQLVQNLPYPIYEGHTISDRREEHSLSSPLIESLQAKILEWAYQKIPNSNEREDFLELLVGPRQVVDYISMLLIKDLELKQMILANNSLFERVQLLNSLFRNPCNLAVDQEVASAIKSYEYLEELAEAYH